MIDLRSLEVFFWVVKLGGFGRAGERLHMSQPAISSRIGQIEARFGIRLLDRSSHRAPVPTAKGLEVYGYAERMLSLRSELVSRLGDSVALCGTARLGVSETLVHTLLGTLMRALNRLHPEVTPEITVDISPNLRAALLAGELDVALLLGPLGEPRVRDVPLRDYDLVWVACPSLGLGGGPLDLRDLARWPILSYARGTQPHAAIAALFGRADLPPARIFANASLASMLRMAMDGIGIGVLPLDLVARDIAEGRLVRLDVPPLLAPLCFTASYVATPDSRLAETVALLARDIARDSARDKPALSPAIMTCD